MDLESLDKRREGMALKFVKNSLKNDNFSKLFPLRRVKHVMESRMGEKYLVNSSKTRRYADSAVPFLQRMLNKDDFEKRKNLKRLMDFESSMSSGKRQSLKQKKLVNYVSNVDVITWENKILLLLLLKTFFLTVMV